MATQAPEAKGQALPLFYRSVVPLSSQLHPNHRLVRSETTGFASAAHAIPITVDEFVATQRHYPIVFGQGPTPAPLALVGLSEGKNLFVDETGRWRPETYVPAYVRRYPFMLAKLTDEAQELSLCFDDSSGLIVPDESGRGEALFQDGQPSDITKAALGFCDQFEQSVQRTRSFVEELQKLELLIDGEVTLQLPDQEQPSVYRGFRMVSEEKLKELRGDQLRKLTQNSGLGLIYAHLFSLPQVRELFAMDQRAKAAA
jgi:hypothetical protein